MNEISSIDEINQSNENNELKNSFPITLNKINGGNPPAHGEDANNISAARPERTNKLHITNIGQLIFVLFLLTVICTQAINIFSGTASNADSANTNIENNANQENNFQSADMNNNAENFLNNLEKELNKTGGADDIYNITGNRENSNVIFILGESEGKLAILSSDRSTVYEIFDIYINTLPEYDRNLLLDGIKITSSEELHSLLEDYSS